MRGVRAHLNGIPMHKKPIEILASKEFYLGLVAFGLLLISYGIHINLESLSELNDSRAEILATLEDSENLRKKFSSAEHYITALEEQLALAVSFNKDKGSKLEEMLSTTLKLLILLGAGQIFFLLVPGRKRNKDEL